MQSLFRLRGWGLGLRDLSLSRLLDANPQFSGSACGGREKPEGLAVICEVSGSGIYGQVEVSKSVWYYLLWGAGNMSVFREDKALNVEFELKTARCSCSGYPEPYELGAGDPRSQRRGSR